VAEEILVRMTTRKNPRGGCNKERLNSVDYGLAARYEHELELGEEAIASLKWCITSERKSGCSA